MFRPTGANNVAGVCGVRRLIGEGVLFKVLFMSGYADDAVVRQVLDAGATAGP